MKIILVHDIDAVKSAICTTVGCGNLLDPQGDENGVGQINGLAHFCEHMLFMGTKKFPDDGYYTKFIKTNGGMANASTAEDYT